MAAQDDPINKQGVTLGADFWSRLVARLATKFDELVKTIGQVDQATIASLKAQLVCTINPLFNLSGSDKGRPIKVVATTSPGTTIHTVSLTEKAFEELHLWAQNDSGGAVVLTLEFGGTTNPDDRLVISIASQAAPVKIVDGLYLSAGKTVKAFAASANVIKIVGYTKLTSP